MTYLFVLILIFLYFCLLFHKLCLTLLSTIIFLYIFFQTQSTKSLKKPAHIIIIRNVHQIAAGKIQKKDTIKNNMSSLHVHIFSSKKDKKKQHSSIWWYIEVVPSGILNQLFYSYRYLYVFRIEFTCNTHTLIIKKKRKTIHTLRLRSPKQMLKVRRDGRRGGGAVHFGNIFVFIITYFPINFLSFLCHIMSHQRRSLPAQLC